MSCNVVDKCCIRKNLCHSENIVKNTKIQAECTKCIKIQIASKYKDKLKDMLL